MNIIKYFTDYFVLAIALSIPHRYAEDIDIYSGPQFDTKPQPEPDVLIVIDNSANWASASQHWEGGIKQGESN